MIEFWIERKGNDNFYIVKVPINLANKLQKFKQMAVYMANGKIEYYQFKLTEKEFKPFMEKLKDKLIKIN
ncbi:hypothetical protein [Marinitoga sp. 38H-ov]|jgi:hypothetical protein|uniref:hypothetical protein n=1 Tax=Marinitoga sp. 38H-ov TaxID=1755814 RepID=UPI0013E9CB56|nr:hypothetical protein [Marinitoga sp. 38H-ov]KAF2955841.1 hypothetical protein AS160_08795 [Marinitoga sp. 38H-ov]